MSLFDYWVLSSVFPSAGLHYYCYHTAVVNKIAAKLTKPHVTNITDITVTTTAAAIISFSALTLLLIVVLVVALLNKAVLVRLTVLLVVDTINFVTIVVAAVVLHVVDDIPEDSQNMFFLTPLNVVKTRHKVSV